MATKLPSGHGAQSSLNKKTVLLVALATSIAPVKGMASRGCKLKPSSEFRTAMSSQSDGRVVQSPGVGRLIRIPVRWLASATVKRLLGKGPPVGLVRSNKASTPLAPAAGATAPA